MAELAGTWTYRSFNPTFVWGNQTPQEDPLIWGPDLALTLRTAPDPFHLEGTIEWQDGGLVLNGNALMERMEWATIVFDITGTGRPRTGTAGWEYRYHGHRTRWWAEGPRQPPFLVGSVIRAKPHNGGDRPAGYVGSFIAMQRQPDWDAGLTGSWTYRSFRDNAKPVYEAARPTANGLILQEAVFKLETPPGTTLRGTIELPGGVLDIVTPGGIVWPAEGGLPQRFDFMGTGRPGTQTDGWAYRYYGHQTPNWAKPPDANRVDQRPTLVGSVVRLRAHGQAAPSGSVYPFIAVKQLTLNSSAFQQNGDIPWKYTCEGEMVQGNLVRDVSPPLAWEGVPNGTKSLVLIMDDPDAPDPNAPQMVWVHWVVYNIPPDTKSLPENAARAGLPQGALHGLNDWASSDPLRPPRNGVWWPVSADRPAPLLP